MPSSFGADLGFGVGVRPVLFDELLTGGRRLGFLEVVTEDFLGAEGYRREVLEGLAARFPIVMHGLSLSIAGTDALDFGYLRRLRDLADGISARWVSDHLSWTGIDGVDTQELLPVPLTEASLAHVGSRVRAAQDVIERPLVLENPSTYLAFAESTMPEPEFLGRLVEETGCRLLLDVNNVYVSGRNLGFDPIAYLDALPCDAVVQIHLAGHRNMGSYVIDSHDDRVAPEVWELYRQACLRCGAVSTLLEWDTRLPRLEVLLEELGKAAEIRAEAGVRPALAEHSSSRPVRPVEADDDLTGRQRELQTAILNGAAQAPLPRGDARGPLTAVEGIAIYGSAFRARHVDTLRSVFPVLGELFGAELDDLALDYLAARPELAGGLVHLARSFATWVEETCRSRSWAHLVHDVVALETALLSARMVSRTDAPDIPPIADPSTGEPDRLKVVAARGLRLIDLVEPSFLRDLADRAGVGLSWSGEPDGHAAVVVRDAESRVIFLGDRQNALLKQLIDGAGLVAATAEESIGLSTGAGWVSAWIDAGILSGT